MTLASITRSTLCVLSATALAASASAQDLLGISYDGQIYALDSRTGATQAVGVTIGAHNAMARDKAGRIWVAGWRWIGRIDPATMQATTNFPTLDIRALAAGPTADELYGLRYGKTSGTLLKINTRTGAETTIGSTGAPSIQSMAVLGGVLYAYSTRNGLMRLNTTTGAGTRIGNTIADIQWMTVRSDGKLIGGRRDIYVIDPRTGGLTLSAKSTAFDLRGVDSTGLAAPFGQGCGRIGNARLSVTGDLRPGGYLTFTSTGYHVPTPHTGSIGFMIVGTSRTSYMGTPLPWNVDPLFRTNGCRLLVSADLLVRGGVVLTNPPSMTFLTRTPTNITGLTLFVQHIATTSVFTNTPETALSNALAVRVYK